ncbi:MAG TPA: DUF222 domain-containing protein [Amycolatopsis sp.]|nr:DUF222 domain-containing protein [Amycolatopsis sp.]
MSNLLATRPRWQLRLSDVAGDVLARQARMSSDYAAQLDSIAELDARGGPDGFPSTAAFLTSALNLTPGEARERIAQARQELPLARKALAGGDISHSHFTEIARLLAQAPDWLTAPIYTATEEALVTAAAQASLPTLRKIGRRVKAYWETEGRDPDDREHDTASPRREFRFSWTRGRRLRFSGDLDAETGSLLEQLMVPLAAPDPADAAGNPDRRTAAERRGDGFAAIVELAARSQYLPEKAGERAVATITISLEDLQDAATTRTLVLDDGTTQPISAMRRMLCDAKIYPAVLGGAGQVLDLGRSARTAPPALRRALILRDRGCTFPGCHLGPQWTEVHHVRHWADGGATDPGNCGLSCTRHHRYLHHSGWDITIIGGTVHWIPPALLDPERKPLRNTAHDPPPGSS